MKTILTLTFALALLLGSTQLNANTPPSYALLTEESYIDDIPFDTEKIYDSVQDAYVAQYFQLEDESFVDDIPFNTFSVVDKHQIVNEPEFNLEEEEFINDIPSVTMEIAEL